MRNKGFYFLLLISCFLGGCSYLKPAIKSDAESFHWQEQQSNCSTESIKNGNCPTINYSGLKFNKFNEVNDIIDQKLLSMLNAKEALSLESYLINTLTRASDGYHLNITVQTLSENDVLIVLMLTIEETPAISQYSAKRFSFINFDKQKQKDIALDEAIMPDKIQSFWSVAELSYQQWLEVQQLLNNEAYQKNWPFIRTDNVALMPKQLILKYNGNTLAPYAMGEPPLFIPYEQLRTILKPEYLPH